MSNSHVLLDAFDDGEVRPKRKRTGEVASVETPCVGWAKRRKWYVRKYKSPGRRSAPDRIFAKFGRVLFIEFKRKGKKPTKEQHEEHEAMRAAGLTVLVFDNRDDCIAYLQSIEDEENW